jgi:diacylglycerol kinase family enzyme
MARRHPHRVEELERAFGDRGPFVATRTVGDLAESMERIRRVNPSALFVAGGDGTLRQTLTHLIAAYGGGPFPKIGVLKAGTMNTVATSLKIRRTPIAQLRTLLDHVDRGIPFPTVARPMLEVNRHYGFIFAVGGFSRFIEHYQARPDPTPAYAFRLVSSTVLSMAVNGHLARSFFADFEVSLFKDRKPWLLSRTVTNVSVSAVRHIGFHFKPYVGAEDESGTLGVLVFNRPPRRLLFHLPEMFAGKPVSDRDLHQVPAHELLVKLREPMRPMLDGDILKADREFLVKAGPSMEMIVV